MGSCIQSWSPLTLKLKFFPITPLNLMPPSLQHRSSPQQPSTANSHAFAHASAYQQPNSQQPRIRESGSGLRLFCIVRTTPGSRKRHAGDERQGTHVGLPAFIDLCDSDQGTEGYTLLLRGLQSGGLSHAGMIRRNVTQCESHDGPSSIAWTESVALDAFPVSRAHFFTITGSQKGPRYDHS